MLTIEGIANGEAFDATDAIRLLAKRLLDEEEPESRPWNLEEAVGEPLANLLTQAGFPDPDSVKAATDEQLLAINGIGQSSLATIRKQLAMEGTVQ